jgi:hypothetical protein
MISTFTIFESKIGKGKDMVVLLFFAIILSLLSTSEASVEDKSDLLSKQEIESFFANLFSRELGYTLIGSKPISEDEFVGKYYQEIGFFQDVDKRFFNELKKSFEGSSNFVLKVFSDGPYYTIELINKRAVRDLVKRNSVLQAFIKKKFRSNEDFYSQIEDRDRRIFKTLRNNDRILGYLFGYDETNIEYYIRRIEVGFYLQKYPFVRYYPLPGGRYSHNPYVFMNPHLYYKRLQPNQDFDSLESEWRWIKQVAWNIEEKSDPVPPLFVSLPSYICRYDCESELTRKKFKRASGKVAELFCNKSFQEAVAEIAAGK